MASPALERRITALDKPLIALAGLAVLIYLGELFRLFPHGSRPVLVWANFLIDSVFLCDLVAKISILGRSYLRSPWFLIDLISTLPVISSAIELLEVLGPQVQFLSAVRVTRVARVGRTGRLANIARVARIARALRVARGLIFLKSLPRELQQTPTFNRALKIGVPLLLVAFVAIAYYFQHVELGRLERDLRQRVAAARSVEDLAAVPGYLGTAAELARRPHVHGPKLRVERTFGRAGEQVTVVLSLERAIVAADRMQGLLLILVLLTVLGVVYIASSLSHDRRRATELALLGQCFSPPIVDKFFSSPDVLQRYFEQWMSVFFVDVRGFTAATQRQRDDLEGLALRLRRVMDIAREEIVVTHQGVVDKFMGDAVMGWFGGHFSHHWGQIAPLRRELLLDQMEEAGSDVLTLEREGRELEERQRTASSDAGALQRERDAVQTALDEARGQLAGLRRRQEEVRAAQPELDTRLEEATGQYRRAVAAAAVRCLLHIVDQVGAQQEPGAFREVKVGLASGPICVGNFGSTQQVGFTILGPTVNRAARLEPASFQCGCKVLVDEETYRLVGDGEEILFRGWGRLEVKGIEGELAVYEPLWASPETRQLLELFHEGRGRAERGELEAALASFTKADELRQGGDPASRLWRDRVQRALGEGAREVGVYHATKG